MSPNCPKCGEACNWIRWDAYDDARDMVIESVACCVKCNRKWVVDIWEIGGEAAKDSRGGEAPDASGSALFEPQGFLEATNEFFRRVAVAMDQKTRGEYLKEKERGSEEPQSD